MCRGSFLHWSERHCLAVIDFIVASHSMSLRWVTSLSTPEVDAVRASNMAIKLLFTKFWKYSQLFSLKTYFVFSSSYWTGLRIISLTGLWSVWGEVVFTLCGARVWVQYCGVHDVSIGWITVGSVIWAFGDAIKYSFCFDDLATFYAVRCFARVSWFSKYYLKMQTLP
jgi:hypothetical protein